MANADLLTRLSSLGWTVTQTGCWEYNGGKSDGYGRVWDGEKVVRAHRASYEAHTGPIAEGMSVLHTCDNPPCINPAHLFLGTIAANNADMRAKGRNRTGEQHPQARLSDEQVASIRAATGTSQHALARAYGVSQSTIADIIHLRVRRPASVAV